MAAFLSYDLGYLLLMDLICAAIPEVRPPLSFFFFFFFVFWEVLEVIDNFSR